MLLRPATSAHSLRDLEMALPHRNSQVITMKPKIIAYWTTTSLIALETFAGGCTDLFHGRANIFNGPYVADIVTSLGYPVYVLAILGVWKIPGALTIVVPSALRLKEWAYAGIVFELS